MSGEDSIRRFQTGEHNTAEQVNLRGDLHKREHFGQTSAQDAIGNFHRQVEEDSDLVLMRNGTGAERLRYQIAGIDDVLFDPSADLERFQYEVWFEGVVPEIVTHNNKWGVFQEKVADGVSEAAKVSGVTQVKVDILETTDPFADIKDATCTELESNSVGGSAILWPNPRTVTGIQWCVVRINGGSGPVDWDFELAATLTQWDTPIVPVAAYRRVWDPSANSGYGGTVTDCTQTLVVGDFKEAGFYGIAGANGWAELKMSDLGVVGVIKGMNCPNACICGSDYAETAPCVGT